MAKIVLADDNELFRKTLKSMLTQHEVVGEACDGQQAIDVIGRSKPDLLLLDLSMPKANGFAVLNQVREKYPEVKVLALTIHASEEYIREALKMGVNGYYLKDEGRQKLLEAISCILNGEKYFSKSITRL
jgi:DNA-binding NarL/FixJ family response regulator